MADDAIIGFSNAAVGMADDLAREFEALMSEWISLSKTPLSYPASQGVESAGIAKDAQVFRTFSSKNTLMLKIGQPVEFSAWADRISGEETRVTITVQLVQ